MKVHHLNCGTMRPWATPDGLICHVLLIETGSGLALVDTGLGTRCAQDPAARFGPARFFVRPVYRETETAIVQVARLGYNPRDVRHIVLTHFDADHTGGIADFPWATVHLTAAENQASLHPRSVVERGRYLPAHREHTPVIAEHVPAEGESWNGFAAAKELTEIAPGIVMIALPGHTRGHAAIAVEAGQHWILHVGDAFYHHGQVDGHGHVPRALSTMERLIAYDWPRVQANHERLAEVWAEQNANIVLVNAHDPTLLARAQELH